MIGFFMTPYHTEWLPVGAYKDYTLIFSWMMFFNVVLTFGMETAFFRFYNKHDNKKEVVNNTLWFLITVCAVFLGAVYLFKDNIDAYFGIHPIVVGFLIWILILDTLAVIPIAMLRDDQLPITYSAVNTLSVLTNASLSVLFLYTIPQYFTTHPTSAVSTYFMPNFQVGYLFLANIMASALSVVLL